MAQTNEGRPLAELLGGLASDISNLFRKEIQLAKAEASEKLSETMAGVVSLLVGTVLALGALGVLLSAIVLILAAFFVNQGMEQTLANAVSAGLVTLVVGIIGWIFISRGLKALSTTNLNMNRTATSLGRDADIVKERL
ncbi:MAG TPA: phage holin family protein [Devosia sp.]|nr:phage holin family protein [Devosia sp.]